MYTISVVRRIYLYAPSSAILLFPLAMHAEEPFGKTTALVKAGVIVLNVVLAAVFVLALIVFAWGVVKYISAAGDAAKIKDSKAFLFWGIIGVFVLASLWGLIKFIAKELSIDSPETPGTITPLKIKVPWGKPRGIVGTRITRLRRAPSDARYGTFVAIARSAINTQ